MQAITTGWDFFQNEILGMQWLNRLIGSAVEAPACCCGDAVDGICCVKVLGAGCKSCHEQYENAKAAVKAMGLPVEVEYITDMEQVMTYGAMSMPAIVVNEKVVSMGRVLKVAEVEKLLRKLGEPVGKI